MKPPFEPIRRNARAPDLLCNCSGKTHFRHDYFRQVKSYESNERLLDAMRNPAMISHVNEAGSSKKFSLPVAGATELLSIIGLVLIGDIVARCGPLT